MVAHLSVDQIDSFNKGLSKGGDVIAIYDHISGCTDCRDLLASSAQASPSVESVLSSLAVEAAGPESHLDYEQIESLVDGGMEEIERETIESHLAVCGFCSSELEEVRALKAGLADAAAAQGVQDSSRSGTVVEWGASLRGWRRVAIQAAKVAAAAAVVAFLATIPFRARVSSLKEEVAQLRRSNQELQANATTIGELQDRLALLEKGQAGASQGRGTSTAGRDQSDSASTPSGPGRETVTLKDGNRTYALDASGHLRAGGMQPSDEEAIKTALIASRVETPPLIAELAGTSGVLRGAREGVAFSLEAPVGTAVLTDRPTLRWRGLEGATSYTAVVYDSSFNPVASSPPVGAREWALPQPLQRGLTYTWQVTALKDGKQFSSPTTPAPEAKFLVLDQAAANRLGQAEREYGDSHLALGVLFARAGLLDDAERELRALARANPTSPVARKLLISVTSLRGRQPRRNGSAGNGKVRN